AAASSYGACTGRRSGPGPDHCCLAGPPRADPPRNAGAVRSCRLKFVNPMGSAGILKCLCVSLSLEPESDLEGKRRNAGTPRDGVFRKKIETSDSPATLLAVDIVDGRATQVIAAWLLLPEPIQLAILTLVDNAKECIVSGRNSARR